MRNYDEYIFSTLKSALALKPHRSNTVNYRLLKQTACSSKIRPRKLD